MDIKGQNLSWLTFQIKLFAKPPSMDFLHERLFHRLWVCGNFSTHCKPENTSALT